MAGDGSWDCPEMDFSDAWGIVPDDTGDSSKTPSSDEWLETKSDEDLNVRVAKLIFSGRGGHRIGSAMHLAGQVRPGWHTETEGDAD